ncbi:hypothetical protein O181_082617 [Austropuccinia psidii MF-1]|uniref:Uncharacterized protein n=1 Tax=Austropuccinia psidii MF-1 TaxID=1389203 RepID=A0A9Q3FQT0_9BASI|nr:hypothetical protein [Austropuccinia psidii MF-1]
MPDLRAEEPVKRTNLPRVLSEMPIDDILSYAKAEPLSSRQHPHLNDVELENLDEKISAKLKEIQMKSNERLAKGDAGEVGKWILREMIDDKLGLVKRRWLVARNEENEVELSVDLSELEAKTEQI